MNKTMTDLCKEFDLLPTQINEWKRQLLQGAADIFIEDTAPAPVDVAPWQAKISQMALKMIF